MLCNWVEWDVALWFYVSEVNLTLNGDLRGLILKADCCGRPRCYWGDLCECYVLRWVWHGGIGV